MGFELDKLMKQYGVSTPTVATYTGTAAPTELTSTATQADKDAFAEQARKYNLDQNAYNQYKQQYQDRMQTGSQYGPPTTAAKIVNPTYGAVGLNMQGMSDADRQAYYNSQRKLGYTMGDLKANAEKTFGVGSVADPNWNGWEGQYNPDYVPPAGPIVATGSAPPVTTTTGTTAATNTAGESYAGQYFDPNDPNSPYYQGYAQGGSIHALAAKYRNGGPVKRHYDDGGNVDFGNDNPANLPTMASPVAGVPSMDAIAAATRAAPMPQAAPTSPPAVDPNAMLASAVQNRTAGTLAQNTRAAYESAQEAYMKSLQNQANTKVLDSPSKAETYFKLAAAFAEPGKTGSFGEGLGRAAGVMGDYQKELRQADVANAMAKRSLENEMAKAKMENQLKLYQLDLTDEEKIATAQRIRMESVTQNGKRATDSGFITNSPEWRAEVARLNKIDDDQAKLSSDIQKRNLELAEERQKTSQSGRYGGSESTDQDTSGATGDDFASLLDPRDANIVKGISNGVVDIGKFSPKDRLKIEQDVLQYNPDWNQQQYQLTFNTEKQFGPNTQAGRSIKAVNAVLEHYDLYKDIVKAIQNGNSQDFNSLKNEFKTRFGVALPNDLSAAGLVVGEETAKAVLGGNSGLEERKAFVDQFSKKLAQGQALSEIDNVFIPQMISQIEGSRQQYMAGTDKPSEAFDKFLRPMTLEIIKKNRSGYQANENIPTITTQEQWDKLKPGAVFIEDGVKYTK